jgi:hypothetical protein
MINDWKQGHTMPTWDQLEIVRASGEIEFYDLDPSRGTTNIGRDPANDIVIDGPGVAPFHAMLDHRQKPYHLVVFSQVGETTLGGQPLPPNVSREIHNWDTIEFDGHTIIVLEGAAAATRLAPATAPATEWPSPPGAGPFAPPVEAMAPAAPPAPRRPVGLPVRPIDQADEVIVTELPEREWTVDVDQAVMFQMTIVNGGDIVAAFEVSVEELDEDWVTILPPQVNLNEGERVTVTITIAPPRLPTSRAGMHYFAVVVTSPNYPNRRSHRGATLVINPYYEFAVGELSPKRQTISWFKGAGQARIPIVNKGNSDALFRLEAEDEERACSFEFQVPGEAAGLATQAEMRLAAEEIARIPVRTTPHSRRLIGLRKRTHSFTVTTTMLEESQMPRAVLGELRSKPLIGPGLILLTIFSLIALTLFTFWPRVYLEEPKPRSVRAGQEVHLKWEAFPPFFIKLSLNDETVEAPKGSTTERPIKTTMYELRGDTWLSRFFPFMSKPTQRMVEVTPVRPDILLFEAQPEQITSGKSAVLSWLAVDADNLILINHTDGVPETLGHPAGSREIRPERNTLYTLQAVNNSLGDQPVEQPVEIVVTTPVPTPPSQPVVKQFIVEPEVITEGQSISLTWVVTGVESVSIQPIGADLPSSGAISHSPKETTLYVLTASSGEETARAMRQVTVSTALTPTPMPTPGPRYGITKYEGISFCGYTEFRFNVRDARGLGKRDVTIHIWTDWGFDASVTTDYLGDAKKTIGEDFFDSVWHIELIEDGQVVDQLEVVTTSGCKYPKKAKEDDYSVWTIHWHAGSPTPTATPAPTSTPTATPTVVSTP